MDYLKFCMAQAIATKIIDIVADQITEGFKDNELPSARDYAGRCLVRLGKRVSTKEPAEIAKDIL